MTTQEVNVLETKIKLKESIPQKHKIEEKLDTGIVDRRATLEVIVHVR